MSTQVTTSTEAKTIKQLLDAAATTSTAEEKAKAKASNAAGEFRTGLIGIIKAAKTGGDSTKLLLLKKQTRVACGLPETEPKKEGGTRTKKEGIFNSTWRRSVFDAFPEKAPAKKEKAASDTKGKATAKGDGPMVKGLTQVEQAFALILQYTATAKTEAKLSKVEALAGEKFLRHLKAIVELA